MCTNCPAIVVLCKIARQQTTNHENDNKMRLVNKINNFKIIERDLNIEIDTLMMIMGDQKRKIAKLENQITTNKGLLSASYITQSSQCLILIPYSLFLLFILASHVVRGEEKVITNCTLLFKFTEVMKMSHFLFSS